MSESEQDTRWIRSRWFWGSVGLGVPFAFLVITSLVEAFATDPRRGWALLAGSVLLLVLIFVVGVGVFRLPVAMRAWAVKRSHPDAIVLVARRALSTSSALSAIARRPMLTRAIDECFLCVFGQEEVAFYGYSEQQPTLRVNLSELEAVSVTRAMMYAGRSNVISIAFRRFDHPVAFGVFSGRTLFATEVSRPRLGRIASAIGSRSRLRH